jgi:deaminated glutathione amidase
VSQRWRCAVIQLHAEPSRDANIARAAPLVREAAAAGAELIVLPEKWTGYGDPALLPSWAESATDGPSVTAMRGWCKELGITLVGGSISEALPAGGFANTSLLITPDGETAALYRKLHMFDVDVAGHRYRESERERAGDLAVVVRTAGPVLGMSICYDLRFPELFRILALGGASVVSLPSAFTLATGRDHWDVLVRARAIENQMFVLAPNQWGTYPNGTATSGRSVIVDPWGVVLARVGDRDGWAAADLDLAQVDRLRAEMPVLSNRRTGVYASQAARFGVGW